MVLLLSLAVHQQIFAVDHHKVEAVREITSDFYTFIRNCLGIISKIAIFV